MYLFKNETHESGIDKEDQRWNHSSGEDDDGGSSSSYKWKDLSQKSKPTKQTTGNFDKFIIFIVICSWIKSRLIN